MKKALKLFLVFAVVATAFSSTALAEVSIGAWGRALWSPVVGGGGTKTTDEEGEENFEAITGPSYNASWGGDARIGFTVAGNSDNVGFQVDLRADQGIGNALENNDQQFIWVKPVDLIKFSVGKSVFYDKYRGNTAFGMWDWIRTSHIVGEDVTFRRVSINDGAIIEVNPMPAFSIFAGMGDTNPEWAGNAWGSNSMKGENGRISTAEIIKYGQYGAGFDFGMGVARLQYTGLTGTDIAGQDEAGDDIPLEDVTEDDNGEINVAVKLDRLVPNLYVDLGAFIYTDSDLANNNFALYVKYNMGTIAVHALAKITLDKADSEGEKGMAMNFGLGVDMDVSGVTLNADFRYSDERDAGQKDGAMSFLLGVKKGYSNGVLGVAFQGTTGGLNVQNFDKENPDDMIWALPIRAEYWF